MVVNVANRNSQDIELVFWLYAILDGHFIIFIYYPDKITNPDLSIWGKVTVITFCCVCQRWHVGKNQQKNQVHTWQYIVPEDDTCNKIPQ